MPLSGGPLGSSFARPASHASSGSRGDTIGQVDLTPVYCDASRLRSRCRSALFRGRAHCRSAIFDTISRNYPRPSRPSGSNGAVAHRFAVRAEADDDSDEKLHPGFVCVWLRITSHRSSPGMLSGSGKQLVFPPGEGYLARQDAIRSTNRTCVRAESCCLPAGLSMPNVFEIGSRGLGPAVSS